MTPIETRRLAELTLAEDLVSGDPTTEATVAPELVATGEALAKSPLVVCGEPVFRAVFALLDPDVEFETLSTEGAQVEPGQLLWRVRGNARSLLQAERSALNLVQRASGIATLTRRFVRALPPGSHARITDTRKTTPGLRALERYAVRVGGGFNHRDNLGSAILIKDNHIVAAGGVTAAIHAARRSAPHTCKIEVEVTDLEMLDAALHAGADIVMLDNFSPDTIAEAVRHVRGRALVEVSGGVTLDRLPAIAQAGVDVISIGALTHSAPAADISLELKL